MSEEKKELTVEEQADQLFLEEFKALSKKHNRDIGTRLEMSPQKLEPKLYIVRLPSSPVEATNTDKPAN